MLHNHIWNVLYTPLMIPFMTVRHQCDWHWHCDLEQSPFQLLLFNRLQNGICRKLTFMKQVFNVLYQVSWFLGRGVTGIRGKQIRTRCQFYGMPYLLWIPNCVARFKALPFFILKSSNCTVYITYFRFRHGPFDIPGGGGGAGLGFFSKKFPCSDFD